MSPPNRIPFDGTGMFLKDSWPIPLSRGEMPRQFKQWAFKPKKNRNPSGLRLMV
jgi:hypothetical protein